MGNDQRFEFLTFKPCHQLARRCSYLVTIVRQIPGRCCFITQGHIPDILNKPAEIVIGLPVGEVKEGDLRRQHGLCIVAQGAHCHTGRSNRARGDFIRIQRAENDILVAVMIFRKSADLGPFKSDKRDDIGNAVGIRPRGTLLHGINDL